jgi:uncharacterized phage-associated protein
MTERSAIDVAEYLLVYAGHKGDFLSNKKLQKLLYYAQAWYLVFYNKELFYQPIEAWIHGPVVPEVYQKYKRFGYNPIRIPKRELTDFRFSPSVHQLLSEIYQVYGDHTADFLEDLAHSELPWIEARGTCTLEEYSRTPISLKTMKRFYRAQLTADAKKAFSTFLKIPSSSQITGY